MPLPKVIRLATDDDYIRYNDNEKVREKALNDAKKISKELKLDMNFVEAYYNLVDHNYIFIFGR